MARRWLIGVSGDESGRASPGVEADSTGSGARTILDPVPLPPLTAGNFTIFSRPHLLTVGWG